MRRHRSIWLMLLLVLSGCGDSPESLVSVRGSVHFHGQPLVGGLIVFTPESDADLPLSQATIEADGSFELHTEGTLGARPGWHRVTIASPNQASLGDSPEERILLSLPIQYRYPNQSGLTREVKADERNVFRFELTVQ